MNERMLGLRFPVRRSVIPLFTLAIAIYLAAFVFADEGQQATPPPSPSAPNAEQPAVTTPPVMAPPPEPAQLPPVTVEGIPESQQPIGPYNQPRWSARGRFSSDLDVYVLPPFLFYTDSDYSGTVPRHGETVDLFTQEFEMGLPHRFQLAYENNFEVRGPHTQETEHTIESRYALANWGVIPLNPTLFNEFHFGVGKDYENDGAPLPDSVELRLLLGEQLGKNFQWALNAFWEQQLGGDRETEIGFAQALSYAIRDEYLKVGVEMQFVQSTDADTRSHPECEFDLGPSFTWKPSRRTRLDIAPLFGTTGQSPFVNVFAVFSIDFGKGSDEAEGLVPVSMQHY